eukprot:Gb_21129 [translate_table: standard]
MAIYKRKAQVISFLIFIIIIPLHLCGDTEKLVFTTMADEKKQQEFSVGQSEQQHDKICGELNEEQQKKLFEVNTAGRKSWPEVVGMSGEDAKKKIEAEHPGLTVQILSEHSFFTADYNVKRVRIFVDSNGIVTKAPMIG